MKDWTNWITPVCVLICFGAVVLSLKMIDLLLK